MKYDNGKMIEQQQAHIFVLFNFCINQVYIVYILSIYPLYRRSIIYQLNSINVIIIMLYALSRWSQMYNYVMSWSRDLPIT